MECLIIEQHAPTFCQILFITKYRSRAVNKGGNPYHLSRPSRLDESDVKGVFSCS